MHTVAKAFTWVLNVYNPWKNTYSPQEWLLLTLDFPWFVALFQATQCKPTFGPLCIVKKEWKWRQVNLKKFKWKVKCTNLRGYVIVVLHILTQ